MILKEDYIFILMSDDFYIDDLIFTKWKCVYIIKLQIYYMLSKYECY